jgi:hypothetical protein
MQLTNHDEIVSYLDEGPNLKTKTYQEMIAI